jgi:hypothetical protein
MQPLSNTTEQSITDDASEVNETEKSFDEMQRMIAV